MVRAPSVNASALGWRGYQLLLLAAAMGAGGYVRTAISPLQETMRIALSISDNHMALLQGPVIGIPITLAAVPLGLLIDRYSRVRLLSVLILLTLLASLFTAFASSFSLLLLARCLAGLTGLSTIPVVFSLLADLYEPAQRGRATTVVAIGQLGGISAAFALGGALLAMKGSDPDGWRWTMLWLTAPLVPAALLMLALREPIRRERAIANPSARQVWDELRHYRTVIGPLVVGVILVETAVGAMMIWAAPMLARVFGLQPDRVGSIMAMVTLVGGIVGPLVGGPVADLCQRAGGPRRTVSMLSGLALLVADMTIMLAVAVMGMTLFTIVIPNEIRGLCMSAFVAANLLFVFAVAPVTVSLLSGAIGGLAMIGTALSVVCATSAALAAATFAFAMQTMPPVTLQ